MQIRTEFPDEPFTWRQVAARGDRPDTVSKQRSRSERCPPPADRRVPPSRPPAHHAGSRSGGSSRRSARTPWCVTARPRGCTVSTPFATPSSTSIRRSRPTSCVAIGATDRPECNGGTRDLRPSDWTIIGGVRVTTPIRTALDLGCKLSRREAIAVMDALMREHGFTVDGPSARASTLRPASRSDPAPATGAARRRASRVERASRGPGSRSSTAACPLPSFSTGSTSTESRRTVSTWRTRAPESRSSTTVRSSTPRPEDRERDARRRQWLRDHGWTVIVLDKHCFTAEAVDAWIRDLRRALGLLV